MSKAIRLSVLPALDSLEKLAEVLHRLAWYCAPFSGAGLKVSVPVTQSLLEAPRLKEKVLANCPEPFHPCCIDTLNANWEIFDFVADQDGRLEEAAVIICVDHSAAELVLKRYPALELAVKRKEVHKVIIDTEANVFEAAELPETFAKVFPAKREEGVSRVYFSHFIKKLQEQGIEASLLLAPGHSCETIDLSKFHNTTLVVPNTLIGQEHILNHVGPVVAVIGDPYFCGVSRYGGNYRRVLADFLSRENRLFVTQIQYLRYFLQDTPKNLHQKMVGVPTRFEGFPPARVNLDLTREFVCVDAWNVTTSVAFPVACSLGRMLLLAGLDGREKGASAMWASHRAAEHDTIGRSHGGLVQADNEEYYARHEASLAVYIAQAELDGKRPLSLTPSLYRSVMEKYQSKSS